MENDYLKILYTDFATKIQSISKYLEKIKEETADINQSAFEMTAELRKKLEAMENFKKSRPSVTTNLGFSTENRQPSSTNVSDNSLSEIDKSVSTSAEKLNYFFVKAEKDILFLQQSFGGLQDIVNNIYDTFEDLLKE